MAWGTCMSLVHELSMELGFSVQDQVDSALEVGFACHLCLPLPPLQIITVAAQKICFLLLERITESQNF